MIDLNFLLVAFFLPLFPFSIVFNALYTQVAHPLLRFIVVLAWPLVGVYLYQTLNPEVPDSLAVWAIATAALYAFRTLAMREVGIWTGYMATSLFVVLWLPLQYGDANALYYAGLLAAPVAVLSLLVGALETRFGAAYTKLYAGIALTVPRLSGVFVVVVLATSATPIFPAFFVMLDVVTQSSLMMAIALVALWGLWSWTGALLVQGMIVGDAAKEPVNDLDKSWTWLFSVGLAAYTVFGIMMSGAF